MILHESQNTTKQYDVARKSKHHQTWLCYTKVKTLRDGVIDAKEIEQWRQILNEYEESLKEITSPKNEEKIDLKKIQEQINILLQQKKW